ncbi:hypothetical protein DF19_13085 [Streptomyces olindensis]|nr:hypothetical protein DF19_13085 [Streptomyces olindensis]
MERFEHSDQVEVVHRSFPLGGGFPADRTISVREALLSKHGISGTQAEAATRRIETLAGVEGLRPYRVWDDVVGNTEQAHEFWPTLPRRARTAKPGTRSSAPSSAGPSPSSPWTTCSASPTSWASTAT